MIYGCCTQLNIKFSILSKIMESSKNNSEKPEYTSECTQKENPESDKSEKSEEKKAGKERLKFDKDKLWSIKYDF